MTRKTGDAFQDYVVRLRPFHYLHLKDTNTNVVRVVIGPTTLTCLEHEQVVFGPEKMVVIPPRHYVIVENPVIKRKKKSSTVDTTKDPEEEMEVVLDEHGQSLLRHGDKEVRFSQPPFPLYDGEKLDRSGIQPLQIIEENVALRLKALRDFTDYGSYSENDSDSSGGRKSTKSSSSARVDRVAGQEWYFKGPGTYKPQVEVQVLDTVRAIILKPEQALKVQARDDCVDYLGKKRKAGEEWLVRKEGAYLPQVHEKVIETVQPKILTDVKALHVRAKTTFNTSEREGSTDSSSNSSNSRGSVVLAGTEWLVTNKMANAYIPGVYEEIIKEVDLIVLTKNNYCIIKDPVDKNGKPQLGSRALVKGPKSFFLQPGESLESTQTDGLIRTAILLAPDQALWLTATEEFSEEINNKQYKRRPGDVWLLAGPGQYWPPIEVKIQRRISAYLKLEPIKLYLFRPELLVGAFVAFVVLTYLLLRIFGGSGSKSEL